MTARFGLDFPPFGALADPRAQVEVAVAAEEGGWDGVFLWDHVMYRSPAVEAADPWVGLGAMAAATDRVALGPMVTPLARRRPQIVARQATAIDQLSGGRFVLGVGLGLDSSGRELSAFGEEGDDRARARMLDESMQIINGLWSGETVSHRSAHYTVDEVTFLPRPVQRPRPPIWVAGRWPYRRPLERAARWDGYFPIDITAPQLAEVVETIVELRGDLDGFDVIAQVPYGDDPQPCIDVGATWILTETPYTTDANGVLEAASRGPIG